MSPICCLKGYNSSLKIMNDDIIVRHQGSAIIQIKNTIVGDQLTSPKRFNILNSSEEVGEGVYRSSPKAEEVPSIFVTTS